MNEANTPALNAATLETLGNIRRAVRTTGVAAMANFDADHMTSLEAAGLIVLDRGYQCAGLPG